MTWTTTKSQREVSARQASYELPSMISSIDVTAPGARRPALGARRTAHGARDGTGAVAGVEGRTAGGSRFVVSEPITIGADGASSFVARSVGAITRVRARHASAFVYTYVDGRPGRRVGLVLPVRRRGGRARSHGGFDGRPPSRPVDVDVWDLGV
jgi:hypothetical protein